MVILLMSIHLAAAFLIAAARMTGVFHFPLSMFPALFILPLWGPLCAVAAEIHIRGGEKADEEAGMARFGITDEIYRNIRMEREGAEEVQPIEDVLSAGTPAQRRRLLLSVLNSGPESFVKPLRLAGVNDDTEVVHYAVTALVELRSSYTQKLFDMDRKLKERPYDLSVMLAAADLDEEYLESGIPEKSEKAGRAVHCRKVLEKLLEILSWQELEGRTAASVSSPPQNAGKGKSFPDRGELFWRLGKICLLLEDAKGAEDAGRRMINEWPEREEGYLLVLRARAAASDGTGVLQAVRKIRESGIYLSPGARQELEFWDSRKA